MAIIPAGMALAFISLSAADPAQAVFRDGFEASCLFDADADRLVDCVEVTLRTDYLDADTDDDGLSDGDEMLGTLGGLDLAAFGVNPRHKDLLVEMDWDSDSRYCGDNHSHQPSAEAVEGARIFSAAAPIHNPDGIDGINFIADYGQGPPPFIGGAKLNSLTASPGKSAARPAPASMRRKLSTSTLNAADIFATRSTCTTGNKATAAAASPTSVATTASSRSIVSGPVPIMCATPSFTSWATTSACITVATCFATGSPTTTH